MIPLLLWSMRCFLHHREVPIQVFPMDRSPSFHPDKPKLSFFVLRSFVRYNFSSVDISLISSQRMWYVPQLFTSIVNAAVAGFRNPELHFQFKISLAFHLAKLINVFDFNNVVGCNFTYKTSSFRSPIGSISFPTVKGFPIKDLYKSIACR